MTVGLDCIHLKCPEFTVPALTLIKKYEEKGKSVVIKTLEKKARNRIQHLCAVHNWKLTGFAEQEGLIFIKIEF
jgi:TusA-related sulfurtransferase